MTTFWFVEDGDLPQNFPELFITDPRLDFGLNLPRLNVTAPTAIFNPHHLYLPPHVLTPGVTYTFRAVTYQRVDPRRYTSDAFSLVGQLSELRPHVVPAQQLVSRPSQTLNFTIELGYVSHFERVQLQLECSQVPSTTCRQYIESTSWMMFPSGNPLGSNTALEVSGLVPAVEGSDRSSDYSFNFQANVLTGNRSSVILMAIVVSPRKPPTVYVPQASFVVNLGDIAPLEILLDSNSSEVEVIWSTDSLLERVNAEDPTLVFPGEDFLSGTTLLVDSTLLFPGQYAFTATVSRNEAAASVDLFLRVNRAPSKGYLIVTPTEGVAFDDEFVFAMLQWEDADLPLQYDFSLELSGGEFTVPLQEKKLDNLLQAFLGPGEAQVVGTVYDALDAETQLHESVSVSLPQNFSGITNLDMEVYLGYLAEALESERPDELSFAVAAVSAFRDAVQMYETEASGSRRLQQSEELELLELSKAVVGAVQQGSNFLGGAPEELGSSWRLLRASLNSPPTIDSVAAEMGYQKMRDLLDAHGSDVPILLRNGAVAYGCLSQLMRASGPGALQNTLQLGKSHTKDLLRSISVAVSYSLPTPKFPMQFLNSGMEVSVLYINRQAIGGQTLYTQSASLTLSPFFRGSISSEDGVESTVSLFIAAFNTTFYNQQLEPSFFQEFWWLDELQQDSDLLLTLSLVDRESNEEIVLPSQDRLHSLSWSLLRTSGARRNATCTARKGFDSEPLGTTWCVLDTVASSMDRDVCVCQAAGDTYALSKVAPFNPPTLEPLSSVVEEGQMIRASYIASATPVSQLQISLKSTYSICFDPTQDMTEHTVSTEDECLDGTVTLRGNYESASMVVAPPRMAAVLELNTTDDAYIVGDRRIPIVADVRSSDLRFDTRGLCGQFSSRKSCQRWVAVGAPRTEVLLQENDEPGLRIVSGAEAEHTAGNVTHLSTKLSEGKSVYLSWQLEFNPLLPMFVEITPIKLPQYITYKLENGTTSGQFGSRFNPELHFLYRNDDIAMTDEFAIVLMTVVSSEQSLRRLPAFVIDVALLNDDIAGVTSSIANALDVELLAAQNITLTLQSEPLGPVVFVLNHSMVIFSIPDSNGSFSSHVEWEIVPEAWDIPFEVVFKPTEAGSHNVTVAFESEDNKYVGALDFVLSVHDSTEKNDGPPLPIPSKDGMGPLVLSFIVLGAVVVLTLCIIIAFAACRRRRRTREAEADIVLTRLVI